MHHTVFLTFTRKLSIELLLLLPLCCDHLSVNIQLIIALIAWRLRCVVVFATLAIALIIEIVDKCVGLLRFGSS